MVRQGFQSDRCNCDSWVPWATQLRLDHYSTQQHLEHCTIQGEETPWLSPYGISLKASMLSCINTSAI